MNKIIYISGAVTGHDPEQVKAKFNKKQDELTERGFLTINPLDIVESYEQEFIPNTYPVMTWELAMKVCLASLVGTDEVHLLPCWQQSRGAQIERNLALSLGIPVVYP